LAQFCAPISTARRRRRRSALLTAPARRPPDLATGIQPFSDGSRAGARITIQEPFFMLRFIICAVMLACGLGAAAAHDYKLGALEIKDPWTRATPKGATVAGGYLTIVNTGATTDRLVGGSAAGAVRFEIHEMAMTGGVMRMRPLPKGLEIKPGATVELKPGSFHLMFMGLKVPLEQGKKVKGTLVFEKAGTIEVEYAVEAIAATGKPHGH
jgi:copper(I)-binding protein